MSSGLLVRAFCRKSWRLLSNLLPLGGKLLAMAAPRFVKRKGAQGPLGGERTPHGSSN